MKAILEMAEAGTSEKSIQGKYRWYKRQYLERFRKCLSLGGTTNSKMKNINEYTFSMVQQARSSQRILHDYMIRRWAINRANEIGARSFFSASSTWILKFKKRYGIVSRKVTDYKGRAENSQIEAIASSQRDFVLRYEGLERHFPRRLVVQGHRHQRSSVTGKVCYLVSVHLENGQRVYFRPENATSIADNPPNTTLTAFFSLCQSDSFARTLLYAQIPTYYTWNLTTKTFTKRRVGRSVEGFDGKASDTIGRVYTVHPSNGECFYLRMLLNKVPWPTFFECLESFNGQTCQTYREACLLIREAILLVTRQM
mgnify:CR=1 FL=1